MSPPILIWMFPEAHSETSIEVQVGYLQRDLGSSSGSGWGQGTGK